MPISVIQTQCLTVIITQNIFEEVTCLRIIIVIIDYYLITVSAKRLVQMREHLICLSDPLYVFFALALN